MLLRPHIVALYHHSGFFLALQVEDPKRALLAYGNKTSQVVKDVLTDLQKLKGVREGQPVGFCV